MEILSAADPQAPGTAAHILAQGGVVVYPTDTLYGLAADATNEAAIRSIFSVKGRDEKKPIHVVVENLDAAQAYVVRTPLAKRLAETFLPGALTIVLNAQPSVSKALLGTGTTLGIRIPNHPFCLALARAFQKPYTATSANWSGHAPGRTIEEVFSSFPNGFAGIDLVIDGGEIAAGEPSTVVDARGEKPLLIREGAIPFLDIEHS